MLTGADKGNPTVQSPSEANRKTLRFNVARIYGSGELACTTRRSDELYLQDDVGNDWQNWRTEAYTANASVAEKLGCWVTPYEPGCWHTPYVDISVPQIVEEIAETRNPLIKCNSNLNVYFCVDRVMCLSEHSSIHVHACFQLSLS